MLAEREISSYRADYTVLLYDMESDFPVERMFWSGQKHALRHEISDIGDILCLQCDRRGWRMQEAAGIENQGRGIGHHGHLQPGEGISQDTGLFQRIRKRDASKPPPKVGTSEEEGIIVAAAYGKLTLRALIMRNSRTEPAVQRHRRTEIKGSTGDRDDILRNIARIIQHHSVGTDFQLLHKRVPIDSGILCNAAEIPIAVIRHIYIGRLIGNRSIADEDPVGILDSVTYLIASVSRIAIQTVRLKGFEAYLHMIESLLDLFHAPVSQGKVVRSPVQLVLSLVREKGKASTVDGKPRVSDPAGIRRECASGIGAGGEELLVVRIAERKIPISRDRIRQWDGNFLNCRAQSREHNKQTAAGKSTKQDPRISFFIC